MFETIDERTDYLKKVKVYEIKTKVGIIGVEKVWLQDSITSEYENEYEIFKGQELLEKMTDEEQDELGEFINDLN